MALSNYQNVCLCVATITCVLILYYLDIDVGNPHQMFLIRHLYSVLNKIWHEQCVYLQWVELIKSMAMEADWSSNKTVPSMDEYIETSAVSFALGPIVLPALYFIGPKISEEMVGSFEYHNLFMLMSIAGRLLNDIKTIEVCTRTSNQII